MHPLEALPGTRDEDQSEPGAAIIARVHEEQDQRLIVAEQLADAFLAGRWRAEDLAERAAAHLGRWPGWLDGLAFAAAALAREAPIGRRWELVELVDSFLRRHRVSAADAAPSAIRPRSAAIPSVPPRGWPLAAIDSVGALAQRLELDPGQLAWLADVRGLERTVEAERLRNYRYRWVARRRGPPRLLEAPKARLKEIQRWVLSQILDQVPAHAAAHGFTRGRSALGHAAVHSAQPFVLRLDLRDFFASVSAGRVYALFRTLGYPPPVAHVLTGLCTNAVPIQVWNALARPGEPWLIQSHFRLGRRLAAPHLPQGAPSSPALANLAAFRLDRRLSGLAAARALRYSRYADDLSFSGQALGGRGARSLIEIAGRIVREEGFALNEDKTLLRSAAARQQVTGMVVNVSPNVARAEYDRLKATLHRLARDGPAGYRPPRPVDPRAHLSGRVAWVASLHPRRGARLTRLLDQIDWNERDASADPVA